MLKMKGVQDPFQCVSYQPTILDYDYASAIVGTVTSEMKPDTW